jgi:hypothetical protein
MEKLLLFILSDSTYNNVVEYVFTDLLSFLKKHDELSESGNHVLSYRCQRVTIDEFLSQFTI